MNVIDRINVRRIRRRFPPLATKTDEEVRDLFIRARVEPDPADTKALVAILIGSALFVAGANAGLFDGLGAVARRALNDVPTVVRLLLWLVVLGGGVTLIAWWNSRWERRVVWRMSQFLCSACGYDLTGNTSGTCPECGRTVEPAGGEGEFHANSR